MPGVTTAHRSHIPGVEKYPFKRTIPRISGRIQVARANITTSSCSCQGYAKPETGENRGAREFVACDNPHANRLMVHMLAAFAEHERDMISLRTKEGLKAARTRGSVLGATGKIRAAENRQQADQHALAILDDIRAIPQRERSSVAALARAMNAYNISTMRGGRWHRPAVYRLIERYQRLGVAV